MRITIETREKDHVKLYLEDEDVAVADIIHHELLPEPKVVFAGAVSTHPLIKKVTIAIRTKSRDPVEALAACGSKVAKKVDELLAESKKALAGYKSKS